VAQQNLIRDDELRDIMADTLADLFQNKIHNLVFQNWKTKQVFEVTSMGGWVEVVPSRIKGNYDVVVVPDSTIPMSKAMSKDEAATIFQMLNGDPLTDQLALRRQMLDKFEGMKSEELLKKPEVIEQEQQAAQQQELLMAILQHGGGQGNVRALKPKQGAASAKNA